MESNIPARLRGGAHDASNRPESGYNLTSRINVTAGVYYNHAENQAGTAGTVVTTSTGSQDSLNFTLGLRYTINQHFALHVDYSHKSEFVRRNFIRRNLRLLAE